MRHTSSLSVLVFIDGNQQDPNKFSPKEVVAIAKEIKRLWPNDMNNRVWFDVEFIHPRRDWWEIWFRVICYRMPGKDHEENIPTELLDKFVNKKVQIHPHTDSEYYNDLFYRRVVEVVHVIE